MIELCAFCGGPIPFFTASMTDEQAAWTEFEPLADGRAVHALCLDLALAKARAR